MAPQVTRGANNIKAKIYTVVNRGRPLDFFGSSFDPKHTASSKNKNYALQSQNTMGLLRKGVARAHMRKYEGDDFKGQRTVLTIPGRRRKPFNSRSPTQPQKHLWEAGYTTIDQVLNGTFQK